MDPAVFNLIITSRGGGPVKCPPPAQPPPRYPGRRQLPQSPLAAAGAARPGDDRYGF